MVLSEHKTEMDIAIPASSAVLMTNNFLEQKCSRWPRWRIIRRRSRIDNAYIVFAVQKRIFLFFWKDFGGDLDFDVSFRALQIYKDSADKLKNKIVFECD